LKKKVLQKLLSATLVGALAIGALGGCGNTANPAGNSNSASGGTNNSQNNSAGGSSESNSGGTEAVAGVEGYTAFADKVTLRIPVYDRGANSGGAPAIGENYWEKWLQENFGDKYNIKLEFVPIPRNEVLTTYTLLASSKTLPTFLMEYDYPKLAQWVADGYLKSYSLDEFAFVAPTYYQRMVDLDQIKYTSMSNDIYFVLAERPYYNTNYTFVTWYRMDWLKQVGYDHIPATREEYLDAMKKIMDQGIAEHPGGGAKSTEMNGIDQNYAFREYPANEEEWAMYGDYAIPSLGWEPNKRLLKELNENYNLGITDPEYYVTEGAVAQANFVNGKTYSYSAYIAQNMEWLDSFYQTNPDGELVVGIQSLEADTAYGTVPAFRSNNPFGMMIGFSSQATDDQIKAAMMYMEWMTQKENLFVMQWGYENEHFKYENGLPVGIEYTASEHKQGFNTNKDYWCVTIEARNAGTIEDTIKASSPIVKNADGKAIEGVDFTNDLISNYYNQVAAWEKGWVPTDCMFATDDVAKVAGEYQATLLSLYAEYRDDLIMCSPAEFDAKYEEAAKKYWEAGYQKIAEARLKALKDGLSSKLQ
jgi:putative aldouronate transport system substrate-binding protein